MRDGEPVGTTIKWVNTGWYDGKFKKNELGTYQ